MRKRAGPTGLCVARLHKAGVYAQEGRADRPLCCPAAQGRKVDEGEVECELDFLAYAVTQLHKAGECARWGWVSFLCAAEGELC